MTSGESVGSPAEQVVLDASALLAMIYREQGWEQVSARLPGVRVSAVNWSEVVAKLVQREHPDPAAAAEAVRALGIDVVAFSAIQAVRAALLWPLTRSAGLSLGDRACLSLAASIPYSVTLTADRTWTELSLGIPIELIR